MGPGAFPVIILTGLSGAGKSTALNVFEDLRFFAVDGLPAAFVPRFVSMFLAGQERAHYRGLVLGLDFRQRDFHKEWSKALEELRAQGVAPGIIFIEAETGVLLRRYAATRRPHPLEGGNTGLEQAVEEERRLLGPLREDADLLVDTSEFSIHDLRRRIQEKWSTVDAGGDPTHIHLISFGFKHGVPSEADLVFDVRFLPNPYFQDSLRPLSGRDQLVVDFVLGRDPGRTFFSKLLDFLNYLLPLYTQEGRYRLTLAIGCTGGRHRSVTMAEAVHRALKKTGYAVSLEHRHIEWG